MSFLQTGKKNRTPKAPNFSSVSLNFVDQALYKNLVGSKEGGEKEGRVDSPTKNQEPQWMYIFEISFLDVD